MRLSIRAIAACAALLVGLPAASTAQLDPLVSGQLIIQGNQLTIFSNELTTDADQTINVNERARVRTCFGGPEVPCGSVQAGDPRIAGLIVEAELRGPELPQAIPLQTVPGGTFFLPSFQQEGDYFLENIRLVNANTGQVLGNSDPPLAVLHVRQIVLASATVRALSLEELRQRGISLTEENFQAFNFAVGFALQDEIVEIEFPVVYSGNGILFPVGKPKVMLDNLPADVIATVARWEPPQIIPFRLEEAPGRDLLERKAEGQEELVFPLFGAIVIPGNLTFLNQFFEAKLIVANGAPGGSDVTLENLHGAIRLPQGQVLRLAQTDPPVAPGQEVPVVQANGSRVLQPGEQGTATWTVEGLRPGTHSLTMDVTGDLVRPGRDPLPVLTRTQAAVEVVDARFNITFSHPDVVREGEEYTLFVTVSNMSQATQNLVTVEILDEYITGAHKEDPNDDFRRTVDSLEPGQSQTFEYELVSDLNGKVIATTFQSDSGNLLGTIQLRTGVGELGIPLSPATLLMPRFTNYIQPPYVETDELVKTHVRLLGLAYSLAVAPAGMIPPGVPRVIRSDVERRAVDLAEAGQRIYLQDQMLESLSVLALDQLGNRHHLAEFDELRRRTNKGLRAASQLAAQLRLEQEARGLGALAFLDRFAETVSYARPWMAAMWVPEDPANPALLEVRGPGDTGGPGAMAHFSDDEDDARRTLPWGEIYKLSEHPTGGAAVPFALVGHADLATLYDVALINGSATTARGRLVLVVPDGDTGDYRRIDFGPVDVPSGGEIAVRAGAGEPNPGAGGFRLIDTLTGATVGGTPSRSMVPLPPFRVIGSRQDFRIAEEGPDIFGNMIRPNRYGSGLTYLFNRPPDKEASEVADRYKIFSTFDGLDVLEDPAFETALKVGTGAWRQENSERVVNVRFSGSIAAMEDVDGSALVDHEQQLDTANLIDERGNSLDPDVPPPIVERVPPHVGGLVAGRVKHGTGDPAVGAKVELIRPRYVETLTGTIVKLDLAGTTTTDEDGRFFFEYIENPNWDRQVGRTYTLRATVPPGDDPELEPAQIEQITSTIRQQNRLARVNINLLGRGAITGRLVYLDTQEPVPDGRVAAASTLFNESKSIDVEADGSFRIPSLPVGPITLTGSDRDGRKVYATVGIENPGDTTDVYLEIQRNAGRVGEGTVFGRVYRRLAGEDFPAEGARIACYSEGRYVGAQLTDREGRFLFDEVPEGRVSLQAADFTVSRTVAFTDLILADGQTVEVDLTIPDSEARTVTGLVYFDDPVTHTLVPRPGVVAFIAGPGNFAYTDEEGRYRIEGVPVQGVGEGDYSVTVLDNELHLEEHVRLPPILDTSPLVIQAETIVLSGIWEGGVDGVVLDPLGRPLPGAELILFPYAETTAGADGSFSFDNIPVDGYTVVAHVGDGLTPGQVGYFGAASARIIYGGHRPFVSVRMGGSGIVNIKTRTATSTGILTPIYYKPTYYSLAAKDIVLKGSYFETSTDPNGDLQLELPVGDFEIVAFNPFHGIRTIRDKVLYAGQVLNLDILFEDAGTVFGQVVDVDGLTPVPDVEVTLHTKTLRPQTQFTDAQGNFKFFLVPKGNVSVTARGLVGTVERVGRTDSAVTLGGQEVELQVTMKAQGSVAGRVVENFNGELRPLEFAQFYVQENTYPFRRLPQDGTFFSTDGDGRYQVSHVYAGRVTVVARDRFQVSRTGRAYAEITADWQVATVPDIVMTTSIGSITVVVRDPATGGPVADAQVRLSNDDVTSTDPQGYSFFEAVPLGTYSIYAFNAPTGQSGRIGGLRLESPGQEIQVTVYLDQRGEVHGTLFDDQARTVPVPGGTVQLSGSTAGGPLTALATTSGREDQLGRFAFLGIPEGTFSLKAAVNDSPRRASASVSLTETAPIADINMVLEPVGDVHVRLFEKLRAGTSPVDLDAGLYSIRGTQPSSVPYRLSYDFTQIHPLDLTDVFHFPDVLLARSLSLAAKELGGEQRSRSVGIPDPLNNVNTPVPGDGSFDDPYQMVLNPKGTVVVQVFDGGGAPAQGVNVTLSGAGGQAADETGSATFYAVRAGNVTASAFDPFTNSGGVARGTLVYDDDVVNLTINLAPSVSAHGIIYMPLPEGVPADPENLVPMEGAIVEIRDSKNDLQVRLTGPDGTYRFDVLPTGGYTLTAQNNNGDWFASRGGSLVGPDGNDNEIPPLILDASPPRIVSIVPPPGTQDVSRMAAVEIVFSEPLLSSVLPSGSSSYYFRLRSAAGSNAVGNWSASLNEADQQVVRFVPTSPYANLTVYSLTIIGGSGGVRDLQGRPVTPYGNVGSNFKTSDSIGPKVIGTLPSLTVPVDPERPLRFDFNEAVVADAELLDGDGVDDAAELFGKRADGVWVPLPVVMFLTRSNYSLQVEPLQGITIEDDTLERRILITSLADAFDNVMPDYEATYRIFDENAPVLNAVPYPANAPEGDLIQAVTYTLTPEISNVDDVTGSNPGGDVDRVEYFFMDPSDPVNPQTPSFSSVHYPFSYTFIGAYSGNGVDPRPFPVWVRAVDTSTNESDLVMVDMRVLPNAPPTAGEVTAQALSPVAGTFYAGSSIRATVIGLDDQDGSRLTLSVELRQDGVALPISAPPGRLVQRPAGGWQDLAPQTFNFTIPIDLPEASPLYFRARVIDQQGAQDEVESSRFPVADDAVAPRVDSLVARNPSGFAQFVFFIGDELRIEFRASDLETAVQSVEVAFDRDDILPSPLSATLVSGTTYRTGLIPVPPDVFTEATPIVATVSAEDWGGNTTQRTLTFDVAPEPDPNAPEAGWRTPWDGAAWPADYSSVFTPQLGTPLLLRALVTDTNLTEVGEVVPGQIVSVRFRGPVFTDSGTVELDAEWSEGELVAGTGAPGTGLYQLLWFVPNQIPAGTALPFAVRAVDSGGSATVVTTEMTTVAARRVYEGVFTAVAPIDEMLGLDGDGNPVGDPDGPVFLLDGSILSIIPQGDGSVRQLPGGLYLYAGGDIVAGALTAEETVLTAPEITSYDSAILYQPLELELGGTVAVGELARIDMDGKGLLGSTTQRSMVLPGEVGAERLAGGSHGGRGWYGSPSGGWNRNDLNEPGSLYDSLRDPALPGGGGASNSSSSAGGAGGGVIRLSAPESTVRLVGDITARGKKASGGGGAGGAIRLVAGRLEGRGRVMASGGEGSNASTTGGGGGGRISISYRELAPDFDPASQVDAAGGPNALSGAQRLGGAGTVFLEPLDPVTGEPLDAGTLVVRNASGLPAALTFLPALGDGDLLAVDPLAATVTLDVPRVDGHLVGDRLVLEDGAGTLLGLFPITAQERLFDPAAGGFRIRLTVAAGESELQPIADLLAASSPVRYHGRTRLAAFEAAGAARVLADDDVELGPEGDVALNDGSRVVLDDEAAVLLRGQGPSIEVTATPADGSDLRVGSTVTVQWTASDSFGITSTTTEWSLAAPSTEVHSSAPREVSRGPITLEIPTSQAPGAVSYRVDAVDAAGRSTHAVLTWTVLENAAPTGAVTMAGGAPAEVKGGYAASVVAHAEDLEGLVSLSLLVGGPVVEVPAPVALSGTAADAAFDLAVPADATGAEPLVVQALITDTSGAQTVTDPLVIAVTENEVPSASVSLAPGASAILQPGESTVLAVHAEDPDGLVSIELQAAGEVAPAVQTLEVSGALADVTFPLAVLAGAQPGVATVTAVVADVFGRTSETAPFELTLVEDAELPVVGLTLVGPGPYGAGEVVEITATASDNIAVSTLSIEIDGVVVASADDATSLVYVWTTPGVAETTLFDVRAEATDPASNAGEAVETVTVDPLINNVPPAVAFDCPTDGATLPSGYTLTLNLSSSDDLGIALVELFRDDETVPFATFSPEVGTPPSFPVTATVDLPVVAGAEQIVRLRAVAHDASTNTASDEIEVTVVEAVDLSATESANDWPALEDAVGVLRSGTLTVTAPRTLAGLILLPGASMNHDYSSPGAEKSVDLTVGGPVYVACGASISANSRGYAADSTYPGATRPGSEDGGSHIGRGGIYAGGTPASTYGSVYRPQEPGGGGQHGGAGGRGGGTVRLRAETLAVDGVIRSNGGRGSGCCLRGGAGGSVWLTVSGEVNGGGSIEARGGESSDGRGSGGGGAIAVEYGTSAGRLLANSNARGGQAGAKGGAGSIYLRSAASTYGDLVIDNGPSFVQSTVLPALGVGVAQGSSGGAVLATDRTTDVPPYFIGHWVEIFDGASEELEGIGRIVAIDGVTVTLEAPAGETLSVDPGDVWQGAYYLDNLGLIGGVPLFSSDPLRVTGTVDVAGEIQLREITAGGMVLRTGARLFHPSTSSSSSPERLILDIAGELVIEPGASIDVSSRGYLPDQTYPGATSPGSEDGGSHIGYGGIYAGGTRASTYGSVYRPQEAGGGGQHSGAGGRGGGIVRIAAGSVTLIDATSAIRANGGQGGGCCRRGGAGGSVWITTSGFHGDGIVEARGGNSTDGRASGGGGAIAVEYETISGTVVDNLRTWGGSAGVTGGPGSVYLFGPTSTYGDLHLDNGSVPGGLTRLPALGSGTAQDGSGGTVLVTSLASIPAYFVGHWVEVRDPASGALKGSWRVASITGASVTLKPNDGEAIDVLPGDLWQGVYRFDNYAVAGSFPVLSDDPIRVGGTQEITGDVTVREIVADNLILRSGAVLRQFYTGSATESLRIELTGDLVIEPGARIDVSGRGYPANVTYPGATAPGSEDGGSHLGRGGVYAGGSPASTFGSVYRPQENGGGGEHSGAGGRGGGTVRIIARNVTLVDGTSSIRANGSVGGGCCLRGGAGGSVWISTVGFFGDGYVEARGANSTNGRASGGGGAIAVEYASASGTIIDNLRSWGGSQGSNSSARGGAGTVYLRGPSAVFGDLLVDNSTISGQSTELPALGAGTAQAGSGGAVLVTDRTAAIPAYFAGHWVEIYDGATGELEGSWRIASIDQLTATLEPNGSEIISVDEGDRWQGVYRFDDVAIQGTLTFISRDPMLVAGTQEIIGDITLRRVIAGNLTLSDDARLRQFYTSSSSSPETLEIDLTDDLVIGSGALITVSSRGYRPDETYPGATQPGSEDGGSHLGYGGVYAGGSVASSFGSVYRPHENGGGGQHSGAGGRGGGAVRIFARNVTFADPTSGIRANGTVGGGCCRRGGAGGSVWVSTDGFFGDGFVEAKGANSTDGRGSGGGGAIAVEYTAASGTALGNLRAWGGATGSKGGAGTVYVHGPASLFGDLIVDNGTISGQRTRLPALGGGVAQEGSSGASLVTGRTTAIPAYLAGHWVEISAADGTVKGAWRIGEIAGTDATLVPSSAGETISIVPGDRWQGVYLFDNFSARGTVYVDSSDPLRVTGIQEIAGAVEMREIVGKDLVVRSGANLRHPYTSSSASPQTLEIELSGDLVIEPNATIDVTGRGYRPDESYPGATLPGSEDGGSHLGHGGIYAGGSVASTFGSVYRPFENGGGGNHGGAGGRGGGTVRIVAENVTLVDATSTIRANGTVGGGCCLRGGAGGSVWITTVGFFGDGIIETRGANSTNGRGSGGGGAIAVEYEAASGTVLDNLRAWGGSAGARGGAGTVYTYSPAATFGDLLVDNNGSSGQATRLPALGSGVAQDGTEGALLVTGRTADIPAYFVGHWIQVTAADATPKGFWRIAAVDGVSFTLQPNAGEAIELVAGDSWEGIYRFDVANVIGGGNLVSSDEIFLGGSLLMAPDGEEKAANLQTPRLDATAVTVDPDALPGVYRVVVPPAAVADADGISELRLSDGVSWTTAPWSTASGGEFLWLGAPGSELELEAVDDHPVMRRSASVRLPALRPSATAVPAAALPGAGPQPRLAAAGGYLVAVYDRWIDVVAVRRHDPEAGGYRRLHLADGEAVVEFAIGKGPAEVVLLVSSAAEEGAEIQFYRVSLEEALPEVALVAEDATQE